MRFLLMIFLSFQISCGQKNDSQSNSAEAPAAPQEEYYTEIREVDLLDVAIDVPVSITANQIVFRESFSDSANGIRTSCSLGVNSGEGYNYRLDGERLTIQTASGERMEFKRVSGEQGLIGSWIGKVRTGDSSISRRLTFVSENRLIMRTHCES